MTITKDNIITLPNPHLRQRSQQIRIITPDTKAIAKDMISATISWENDREHELGVALAAIQIDKPQRIIIIRSNLEDKEDHNFQVLINPEIIKQSGPQTEDLEGCLSVPDLYGKVMRYEKIRIKATTLNGRQIKKDVDGFLARIIQHEIDHTNGIVFTDHIKGKKDAFYKLNPKGELESLDYEKDIRKSRILW